MKTKFKNGSSDICRNSWRDGGEGRLKMGAVDFSYTLVPTYQTARRPEMLGNAHHQLAYFCIDSIMRGTAVAQWLRCCATNRKVAGSIPDGVIGIFH